MRTLRILLFIQAGAALCLAACALGQLDSKLAPPFDGAGSLDRWGSFAFYAIAGAVSLTAALSPGFRRVLGAPFPGRARGVLGVLVACAGLLSSAVLLLHAVDGDVWLSAKVTPFRHPDPLPYLLGAAALAGVVYSVMAIVEACLERSLDGRPGLLRVVRRIGLLLFALASGVLLIEAGLRLHAVVAPRTDGLGVTPGASLWIRRHVQLNQAGFRDEELTPREPDELVVAVLGDSLIYGYGIERIEDRATERLEALLEKGQPMPPGPETGRRRPRVVNVALPGAGTRRQLEWLRRVVLPLSPDLVVLGHYWNDIWGAGRPVEGEPGEPMEPGERAPDARQYSFLRLVRIWVQSQSAFGAQLIKARYILENRKKDPSEPLVRAYGDPELYSRHLDLLQAMHRIAGEQGVPFAVLLLPDFGYPFAESPFARVGAKMEEDLRKRGVSAYDLVRVVPPPFAGGREIWVNSSDSHPNREGQAYIGEGLHRVVLETVGRAIGSGR